MEVEIVTDTEPEKLPPAGVKEGAETVSVVPVGIELITASPTKLQYRSGSIHVARISAEDPLPESDPETVTAFPAVV